MILLIIDHPENGTLFFIKDSPLSNNESYFLNHPKITEKYSLGDVFYWLLNKELDNDSIFQLLLESIEDIDPSITLEMLKDIYDGNEWERISHKNLNTRSEKFTVYSILCWY